jgi:hypothetical protein
MSEVRVQHEVRAVGFVLSATARVDCMGEGDQGTQ